jgi:very-short-patch-repair endonuclease
MLEQLREAGLSRSAIAHRVTNRQLRRMHRGVYLLGPVVPPMARELAAVFACEPSAFVREHSAAALWDLLPEREGPVQITVVGHECRRTDGIDVRVVQKLDRRDVARHHGIPVTAPPRTVIDLAGELGTERLRRVVHEALNRRLVTRTQLIAAMERAPRSKGIAVLRAILSEDREPEITKSKAEKLMLRLVDEAGLPRPKVNHVVDGKEVDFYWPGHGLVVEFDSWQFHSSRAAFKRDRERDAQLLDLGIRTMRVTWDVLIDQRLLLTARLARALAAGESAHATRAVA